jgi:hypothetical protein
VKGVAVMPLGVSTDRPFEIRDEIVIALQQREVPSMLLRPLGSVKDSLTPVRFAG